MDIGIIGLGYVGLPLTVAFASSNNVFGYDINETKIHQLSKGELISDLYVNVPEFTAAIADNRLKIASEASILQSVNVFIVTVPTPVDAYNVPNLFPLLSATRTIAQYLKKGDTVVYESTVYPGCTEEECIPILEKDSGLKLNVDFTVGYSPERINPGDHVHTLKSVQKIISASSPQGLKIVRDLYSPIVEAGLYEASSIKVAEAAKVIENAQRDINISFVNELSLIFDKMGIDTKEVLDAASTKWNFLKFVPGLVGGHCISVDPYYLVHKSQALGYVPQVILSGRRVNGDMGAFIANKIVKLFINRSIPVKGAKVLILGFAFKENCGDYRNTKVIDIYKELLEFGVHVSIYDPNVSAKDVAAQYKIDLQQRPDLSQKNYDAVILAVPHEVFLHYDFQQIANLGVLIYDVKSVLPKEWVDARL